ncbi:MAG: patatin-like phospholipase family protein, partial [Methylocystis sp.]|nr:patatin-like phospholipase family protein [Methylocystis sp.]
LRMIALLRRAANPGDREGSRWAGMRMHRISTQMMTELSASSKLIAEWDFLCMLRDEGRRSAQNFLDRHERDVGVCSTLDLDALLERV